MALTKTIQTEYGVDAKYHTIVVRNVDDEAREALLVVRSFVSRAAYRNGARALMVHRFVFTPTNFAFTKNDGVPQFYAAIKNYQTTDADGNKTASVFADALDELENAA